MQIFVRKTQGQTITLNAESHEMVCNVKRKFKEKEGIRSDLHLGFIYGGKLLEDERTLAHYNISKESNLHLFMGQRAYVRTWRIYVKKSSEKMFTLTVNSLDTINSVKARIREVKGIPPNKQSLFFMGKRLDDGSRFLKDCHIEKESILHLADQFPQGDQPNVAKVKVKVKELEVTVSENKKTEQEIKNAERRYYSEAKAAGNDQGLKEGNKKTEQEIKNAERRYYSEAKAAGNDQGLKEGKAKRLKSVEFLHHLSDASMQYLDCALNSCREASKDLWGNCIRILPLRKPQK